MNRSPNRAVRRRRREPADASSSRSTSACAPSCAWTFSTTRRCTTTRRPASWGSRAAMASLLDILAITTRGDVRARCAEGARAPPRHAQRVPEQARGRRGRLTRADVQPGAAARRSGRPRASPWLQPLRDSEFLAAIKHRSAIPGGTCEFDLPDYSFWLNQPAEARIADLQRAGWPCCGRCAMPSPSCCGSRARTARAQGDGAAAGCSTSTSTARRPIQLLRISLPAGTGLYPEISGSHHRCSMRFLAWNGIDSRADADRRGRALHADLLHLRPSWQPKRAAARPASARSSGAMQYPCRPFCSERCRMVDLGAWLANDRAIPGDSADELPGAASREEDPPA